MATKKVAPKKRTTVHKKAHASTKLAPMKSFKIYKDPQPFTSLRITRQTVYWIILILFIVFTQLWILKLQMDIADLTDTLTTLQTDI